MKIWVSLVSIFAYASLAFVLTNLLIQRDQEFVGHAIFLEQNSQYSYVIPVLTQNNINVNVTITVQGRLNSYKENLQQTLVQEYLLSVEYDSDDVALILNQIVTLLRKSKFKVMNIKVI